MSRPRITDVRVKHASMREKRGGLRAYVSFLIDDALRVDGVTVRLTAEGQLALSYPARTDRWGLEHPYLRPIDDATRRALEVAVLSALGFDGGAP